MERRKPELNSDHFHCTYFMQKFSNSIVSDYLRVAKMNFISIKSYADKSIEQLNEEEIHLSPENETNSVAILIQHISGNLKSRFTDFLFSDGEKPSRNRDAEFEDTNLSKKKLLENWEESWKILFAQIEQMNEDDFMNKTVYIRSEAHTVLEAINRQVWHYGFHAGQIVMLAKQIKGADWKNLSIPKGTSTEFNKDKMK